MNLTMRLKRTLVLLFLVPAAWSSAPAQEKRPMTVEWIFSDECQEAFSLPLYRWLDNGTALYYDAGRPKEGRTL